MADRFSSPPKQSISDPMRNIGTRTALDLDISPARPSRPHFSAGEDGTPINASHQWAPESPARMLGPNGAASLCPSPQRYQQHTNAMGMLGDDSRIDHGSVAGGSPSPFTISRLYSEYNSLENIGFGNFGSVTRGVHDLDGCTYAIKKVSKPIQGDADLQHRLQEIYALSSCGGRGSSPYILRYHDAWIEEDGYVCIRTEYLSGGNMRSLCVDERNNHRGTYPSSTLELTPWNPIYPQGSPLVTPHSHPFIDPCRVWEFLFQMSMGLNSIHTSNNMAHLDVKPDNIFVSVSSHTCAASPGGPPREYISVSYKLGDFGLARPATLSENDEQYRGLNDDEGDKRYLCPYLLNGRQPYMLKEADVYSLGASALEVMGCRPAAEAKSEQELREWIMQALPIGLTQCSDDGSPAHAGRAHCVELAKVISSMVRREPALRPSTLDVAMACYRGMQFFRVYSQTHVANDIPNEVLEVERLRRQIEEVEQQLHHLATENTDDGEYAGGTE